MELNELFPNWYAPATAVARVSPEQYTLRRQAVEAFVGDITLSHVLGLVRVFYKKTGGETTKQDLNTALQEQDPSYDSRNNDFDLQILSAICLNLLLSSKADSNSDCAALALHTSSFNKLNDSHMKESVSEDLFENAAQYLRIKSRTTRQPLAIPRIPAMGKNIALKTEEFNTAVAGNQLKPAIDHLTTVLQTLVQQAAKTSSGTDTAITALHKSVQCQEELSSIHWWMSGEYSNDLEKSYRAIDLTEACLLVGKELADLTRFGPSLYSAKGIINRVLSLTNANEASTDKVAAAKNKKPTIAVRIRDVINAIPDEWDLTWLEETSTENIENLCPIHFALRQKIAFGKNWAKPFEHASGLTVSRTFPALEISHQFYLERMLAQTVSKRIVA